VLPILGLYVLCSTFAFGRNDDYPTTIAGCHLKSKPSGAAFAGNLKGSAQDYLIDPWSHYNRECTSFAAWRLASRNGFNIPFHGNAVDWKTLAQARGYSINNTPAVGAIAWFSYGHVAWVEAVNGSQVTIEEYNYPGGGSYNERTLAASGVSYFIHFKDLNVPSDLITVFRLREKSTGWHFWTSSTTERDALLGSGNWVKEDDACRIRANQAAGCVPLERFCCLRNGSHIYLVDPYEIAAFKANSDWRYEGHLGFVGDPKAPQPSGTMTFFRYANLVTGDHLYTIHGQEEIGGVGVPGSVFGDWRYEGNSGYVWQ